MGGVSLRCLDFGGHGPAVLILHGLGSEGMEWADTATWLCRACRVYALDQRGHGGSDRTPGQYDRSLYVADAAAAVQQLGLAPVVLVGHSMGGLNAYLVAARHPELVRALVVVEALASANPDGMSAMRDWLRALPVPFETAAAARAFVQEAGLHDGDWQELLDERPDGWWPRFDVDGAIASTTDMGRSDYWEDWRAIQCPTLVVGGADSPLPQAELQAMALSLVTGRYVLVEGAGHSVHLERPDAWRAILQDFLAEQDLAGHRPGAA